MLLHTFKKQTMLIYIIKSFWIFLIRFLKFYELIERLYISFSYLFQSQLHVKAIRKKTQTYLNDNVKHFLILFTEFKNSRCLVVITIKI